MTKMHEVSGKVMDISLAILSMIDLTTDIIVLINWYNENKMVYFGISISFIILAQLSFSCMFHADASYSRSERFISIICTLPFLPFLQIAWTLRMGSKNMDYYYDENPSRYYDYSTIKWIFKLWFRNMPYFLHGLLQSFPQCILQVAAIIHFKQTNDILLSISILISILMICSQFYVFLLVFEHRRFRNMLYLVLCFMVDFIGFIFIISVSFYDPKEMSSYFQAIQYIYLWEGIICIGPLLVYCGVFVLIFLSFSYAPGKLIGLWDKFNSNGAKFDAAKCIAVTLLVIIGGICVLSIILIIVALSMALAFILLIIASTSLTIYVLENTLNEHRLFYVEREERKFYYNILEWILHKSDEIKDCKGNVLLTAKQNKIMKISIVNQAILEQNPEITMTSEEVNNINMWNDAAWWNYYDPKLVDYLQKNDEKDNFKTVSLKEMRQNCTYNFYETYKARNTNPFKEFGNEEYFAILKGLITNYDEDNGCEKCLDALWIMIVGSINYILGPMYFLSKILNFFMPFIIVLYLGIVGKINYFMDVDIFLVIVWCLNVVFVLLWMVSLYFLLNEEYYAWHIIPSSKWLKASHSDYIIGYAECADVQQSIDEHYFRIVYYPLIASQLEEKYGADVMNVIEDYLNSIPVSSKETLIESLLDNLLDRCWNLRYYFGLLSWYQGRSQISDCFNVAS